MKSCNEMNELISLYIDNELDDKTRVGFEEHILSCGECKLLLDEMLHVVHLCNCVEDAELPENFKTQLHNKLKIEKQQSKVINWGRYLKVGSTIAAGLLIMILVKGFMNTGYFMPVKMDTKSENQMSVAENQAVQDNQNSGYGTQSADKVIEAESKPSEPKKAEESKSASTSTSVVADKSTTAYTLGNKDTVEKKSNSENVTIATRSPDGVARTTVAPAARQGTGALATTSINKNTSIAVSVDNIEAATDKIKSAALSFGAKFDTENVAPATVGKALIRGTQPEAKIAEAPVSPEVTQPPSATATMMFDTTMMLEASGSLSFKILSTEYDKFIAFLKENFGEASIQIGEADTQNVTNDQTEVINQENDSDDVTVTVTLNKK